MNKKNIAIYGAIIFGLLFTIGNIVWPLFDEPKLFYVPLAIMISFLIWFLSLHVQGRIKIILVNYLLVLSLGNIIKQVFYTDALKQLNDYAFGALITLILIIQLVMQWVNPKKN